MEISKQQSHTKHTQVQPSEYVSMRTKSNKIKKWIYRYNILQDGKTVEKNIIGWQTALAHARKWTTNLFKEVKKVEILNLWTGEIISIEEAERRVKQMHKE